MNNLEKFLISIAFIVTLAAMIWISFFAGTISTDRNIEEDTVVKPSSPAETVPEQQEIPTGSAEQSIEPMPSDEATQKATPAIKSVANPREKEGFQAGIAVMVYRSDYQDMDDLNWKIEALFDRLIGLRINTISLNWPIYQDGARGSTVHAGEDTPTIEELGFIVEKAHKRNFSVMLRPIIDEANIVAEGRNDWRGTIRPESVDNWFASYTSLLAEYAEMAESENVDIFNVGTELVSMERYTARWTNVINNVKKVFNGEITYSSNRAISSSMPWDMMDFISIDAFFELEGPDRASIDQIRESWKNWVSEITHQAEHIGKPVVFTEIGTTSQLGSWKRSWVWDHRTSIDQETQYNFYAATCLEWKEHLAGMYWWAANIWLPEDPQSDAGYSPIKKMAERAIKKCYQTPQSL